MQIELTGRRVAGWQVASNVAVEQFDAQVSTPTGTWKDRRRR